nr:hypothetical protein [Tanacetum cinerariifolium]
MNIDDSMNETVDFDRKTEIVNSKEDMESSVRREASGDNEGHEVKTDAGVEELVHNTMDNKEEDLNDKGVNKKSMKDKDQEEIGNDEGSSNKKQDNVEWESMCFSDFPACFKTFKTLCLLDYALMKRHDYDLTSSLRRGALHSDNSCISKGARRYGGFVTGVTP